MKKNIEELDNMQEYLDSLLKIILNFLPTLVLAFVFLVVGFWLVRRIVRLSVKAMEKKDIDPSLRGFLRGIISVGLRIILVVLIAGMLGFQTSSLVAVLGAAGLAIGLALQGSLSNFAGGILILLFKPFRVGDLITSQGETGEVTEIQIFYTILKTFEGRIIIMPNGQVSNNTMINHTKAGVLRISHEIGIEYAQDIDKAREIILKILVGYPGVLAEPPPVVWLGKLADSAVVLFARCYVNSDQYWEVHYQTLESIKKAFDENGIAFPFPQRTIHIASDFKEKL